MRTQTIEDILDRPTTSDRARRAQDAVSRALTEVVMAKGAEMPKAAEKGFRPPMPVRSKKGGGKSDPGPRRKREIDDGPAGRSRKPSGGSPKRKGLSRVGSPSGPSVGRTRGKKPTPRKPAPGKSGVRNRQEMPGTKGRSTSEGYNRPDKEYPKPPGGFVKNPQAVREMLRVVQNAVRGVPGVRVEVGDAAYGAVTATVGKIAPFGRAAKRDEVGEFSMSMRLGNVGEGATAMYANAWADDAWADDGTDPYTYYENKEVLPSDIRKELSRVARAHARNESVDEGVVTLRGLQSMSSAITDSLTRAYQAALSFKGSLDTMEEIPQDLLPKYKRVMKIMGYVRKAKDDAYQTQMELRRLR